MIRWGLHTGTSGVDAISSMKGLERIDDDTSFPINVRDRSHLSKGRAKCDWDSIFPSRVESDPHFGRSAPILD